MPRITWRPFPRTSRRCTGSWPTPAGGRSFGPRGLVDEFILANVLQLPRAPKAHRRKTDAIDTARLQREYLNGQLPRSHQSPTWWREVRRLVRWRESLVSRRTAVRNALNQPPFRAVAISEQGSGCDATRHRS